MESKPRHTAHIVQVEAATLRDFAGLEGGKFTKNIAIYHQSADK